MRWVSQLSLKERCREAFDATIRGRGENYFLSGFVSRPKTFPNRIQFKVQGSRKYQVEMTWETARGATELHLSCTCPYFEGDGFCKHCWAAIIATDHHGLSVQIPGQKLKLVYKEEWSGFDLFAEPAEESREANKSSHWAERLRKAKAGAKPLVSGPAPSKPKRQVYYVLDLAESKTADQWSIAFYRQEKTGALSPQRVSYQDLPAKDDPLDREIISLFLSRDTARSANDYFYRAAPQSAASCLVPIGLEDHCLALLSRTGRFFLSPNLSGAEVVPLTFVPDQEWSLRLQVTEEESHFSVSGEIFRGDSFFPLRDCLLALSSGIAVFPGKVVRLENLSHLPWIDLLKGPAGFRVPKGEEDLLVDSLLQPGDPPVSWPPSLSWETMKGTPVPNVLFSSPRPGSPLAGVLGSLRFEYGSATVSTGDVREVLVDSLQKKLVARNPQEELGFETELAGFECISKDGTGGETFFVAHPSFPDLARKLLAKGWKVEAQGKRLRAETDFKMNVSSGLDWFDLSGEMSFPGGLTASLPLLLAALSRGENLIALGDGTFGVLPEEWLKKYAPLATLGTAQASGIRFSRAQGALLVNFLGTDERLSVDRDFSELRQRLCDRRSLKPRAAPRSFRAQLRPYQKAGLGWLQFLRDAGIGGILADDMGLGKTVQLLAHLLAIRNGGAERRPSLVILPKSLLFNWQEEASRFAPGLKVLAYAGLNRSHLRTKVPESDLVLITYATLRQDLEHFRSRRFDTIVADEAQAIKNIDSLSHKACAALTADHRVALTGTPIENSLDDLYAILSFVNPGLFGTGGRERLFRNTDHEALARLAGALRPFILRRTKAQVLRDLPEKTEQVLQCELSPKERRLYAELRDYYRLNLRGEIAQRGLARSKIVILEALLRLRQSACHPGLVDKKYAHLESAKLEALFEKLGELRKEGHKALLFSQFTSFLEIVRSRLAREGYSYLYLDGKTKSADRQERVTRFQNDPSISVFLISLKAGGVGLNLTAADYVFILDPWWNPAVEAQAIDRVHRIGQQKPVIAYRIIAKDTVEEKILQLQKTKRDLADAIVQADTSLLRSLTPQDLDLLLS